MLIIPMGTDAPIYHWPRATVAMIVLNVVCFFAVPPPSLRSWISDAPSEATSFDQFALTLGNGLHPVQWVTHNFLHIGIGHLIGNMIFLWAFGIVVEGKLGMARFLAVYLLIGTLHGALTQTLLLPSGLDTRAVGASAIIFGLLAICMVWAPHNEVNCTWIMWFGFRLIIHQFDLRYTWVALLYIGEQILNIALAGMTGRAVISEMGHLSGALWGFLIGFGMLKNGMVDCEGWDMLSLWKKDRKLAKDWQRRGEQLDRQKKAERAPHRQVAAGFEAVGEQSDEERVASASKKLRKLIDMGDYASAVSFYDRSSRILPEWPSAGELLDLIKAMHAQKAEVHSLPFMYEYGRKYPESASKVRLKLAMILIRDRQKPVAALRVLAEIPEGALVGSLEATRSQLVRQAEKMCEEGVLELEGED